MQQTLKAVLRPWGNSHGIRISKEMMNAMGILPNEELSVEIRGNSIVLRKHVERKTLPEYAEEFGGKLGPYQEFDWEDGLGIGRWLDEED